VIESLLIYCVVEKKEKDRKKGIFLFKTVISLIFFYSFDCFWLCLCSYIFVGLALVVFSLALFALVVFSLALFALIVYDLAGICCIRMADSDFIIFEFDISDDE
jgi:hypothetical protein